MDDHAPKIIEILSQRNQVVVVAPPGTGKSTRLPLEILKAHPTLRVLMLEPRRIAAKSLATYISKCLNEEVGQSVGYHFRREKKYSSNTRLRIVTEAMLLRYVQSDPLLSEFDCVIVDEFHERNLYCDLSVSYLKKLSQQRPLQWMVMSATLDLEPLKKYLPDASTYIVEHEQHPINIQYADSKDATQAVRRYLDGLPQNQNILFFLPGKGEIHYWYQQLIDRTSRPIQQLHGELSTQEQSEVIQKEPLGKIILSTNLAESALTVDGVRHVIDSGEKRWIRYDGELQKNILEKRWISQSSAKQRAGRAQRQGPGTCLRLYSEGQWRQFLEHDLSEVLRLDLSHTILLVLKTFHTLDIDWFESPRSAQIEEALAELKRLEAVRGHELTPLGHKLSELSHSVHWSTFILKARSRTDLNVRLRWMALCTNTARTQAQELTAEVVHEHHLSKELNELKIDFQNQFEDFDLKGRTDLRILSETELNDLHRDLLFVFQRSVARVSKVYETKVIYKLFGTGSVEVEKPIGESLPEYAVVLSSHASKNKNETVQRASYYYPLQEAWLMNTPDAQVVTEYLWNDKKERVEKYSQLKFGPFVLMSEREAIDEFDEEAGRLFLKEKLRIQGSVGETSSLLLEKLSHRMNVESLRESRTRLLLALQSMNGDTKFLEDPNIWLPLVMSGICDAQSLEEANWMQRLLQNSTQTEIAAIEPILRRDFPEFIQMRTKRFKVHYSEDQAPFLAARIQEFYGLSDSVSINGGKTKLNLHLLGPNMRPLQVTQDLKSFWQNHYPSLKKELQRRYPRHLWPENPSDANWEKSIQNKK